jgi:hypothetical protein
LIAKLLLFVDERLLIRIIQTKYQNIKNAQTFRFIKVKINSKEKKFKESQNFILNKVDYYKTRTNLISG